MTAASLWPPAGVVALQAVGPGWLPVGLIAAALFVAGWAIRSDRRRRRAEARAAELTDEVASIRAKLDGAHDMLSQANEVLASMVMERGQRARWLEEARVKAEEANRAKSGFLASVSHELRTPLNSVIGFARQLHKNRGGRLDERELAFAEKIVSNGYRLLNVIDRILDLSALEARALEIRPEEVDLSRVIREAVEEFEMLEPQTGVEIVAEVPAGLRPAVLDPARLQQVLAQLLDNAVKFTEGGRVTVAVRTETDGSARAVEVSDEGAGIPPDRLDAIFEAFNRLDDVSTRREGGLGLGLTLAKRLCDLMGYGLEVESAPGEGSTFRIVLPTGPKAAAGGGPTGSAAEALDGERRQA